MSVKFSKSQDLDWGFERAPHEGLKPRLPANSRRAPEGQLPLLGQLRGAKKFNPSEVLDLSALMA